MINQNSIFNKMKNFLKVLQVSHVNHLTPARKKNWVVLQRNMVQTTSNLKVNSKNNKNCKRIQQKSLGNSLVCKQWMGEAKNCLSKITHQLVELILVLLLVGMAPNSAQEMPKGGKILRHLSEGQTFMPVPCTDPFTFSNTPPPPAWFSWYHHLLVLFRLSSWPTVFTSSLHSPYLSPSSHFYLHGPF